MYVTGHANSPPAPSLKAVCAASIEIAVVVACALILVMGRFGGADRVAVRSPGEQPRLERTAEPVSVDLGCVAAPEAFASAFGVEADCD